jgi:3-hydroxypropanoate dehydrogenase
MALDDLALNQLFRDARTHNAWQDKPVTEETLRQLYDLLKWGPTAANSCPARFVFLLSPQAKARLKPTLAEGNVEKTMCAPVTVIIAQDMAFYEHLPTLFPHTDARAWFVGNPVAIEKNAFRGSSLQAAYLIMAARALGLDCGPMSGFDADKLNAEFFPDGQWQVNFICNLGYGNPTALYPRNPRLNFEQACRFL